MDRDRAVSVAVTHVLTIGITTILISGLLLAGGNLLDQQSDRAADRELRTIGDRISTELATAGERGNWTDSNVTIRTQHPSRVVGSGYTVELEELSSGDECFERQGYDGCVVVTGHERDLVAEVPVSTPDGVDVEDGTALGGQVTVQYWDHNSTVTIRGENA